MIASFFVCPEEVEYKYQQLKVPLDPSTPDLCSAFKIIKKSHSQCKLEYTFESDAMDTFIAVHDSLGERKLAITDDDNRRGILSKSKGQCARIAMILQALETALDDPIVTTTPWNTVVSKRSVERAKVILDYVIDEKFSLMPPEIKVKSPACSCFDSSISDSYLTKFLSFDKKNISASDVSQYRLMPPTPLTPASKNKYPVEKVREYLQNVSTAGFGTVTEEVRTGSKRKTTMFTKHALDDMTSKQHDILKKLKVDVSSFSPQSSLGISYDLSTSSSINLSTSSTADDSIDY